MADFAVKTDLKPYRELSIEANFEVLKAELGKKVEAYRQMVVTEDGVQAAKADLANLRRVLKQIDDVRLAVKREMTLPVTAFENRCKDLKSIVEAAVENLDGQVKGFEARRREEKLTRLEQFFADHLTEDVEGFISFERLTAIFPKWGNATYTVEAAQSDIARTLATVRGGVSTLRQYPAEYRASLLQRFRETLDLGAVVSYYEDLRDQTEREARRQAEREAARNAAERPQEARKAEEIPEREPAPGKDEAHAGPLVTADGAQNQEPERTMAIDFRVWATRAQLLELRQFLEVNKIRYGKVPEK